MKKLLIALFACCLAGSLFADEATWMTSVPEAKAKAEKEKKMVMLDFTGSDWCYWCKKIHTEIFSKSEFADYANKNLVLVQVDFPKTKTLSDDLKAANQELKTSFKVKGFPTLVLLKPDGTELWRQVGYKPGGASAMISALDAAKQK